VTVTTPIQGIVCNPSAKASHGKPVYKFEVFSYSRSGDILGGIKKLNGSRDNNHAPFGGFFYLVRLDIA